MKFKKHILIFVLISIVFIFLSWLKRDIIFYTNTNLPIISAAILGILIFIFDALYILFGFLSIILNIKKVKIIAFVMLIIYAFTIFTVLVFPKTDLYINIDYNVNNDSREATINMIKNDEIDNYRIGLDKYIAPFRQTSYTGTMHLQEENGVLKVMFYVYLGLYEKSIIVYVSDDGGINPDDFSADLPEGMTYKFNDIKKYLQIGIQPISFNTKTISNLV